MVHDVLKASRPERILYILTVIRLIEAVASKA
jgi:hypothetical protein